MKLNKYLREKLKQYCFDAILSTSWIGKNKRNKKTFKYSSPNSKKKKKFNPLDSVIQTKTIKKREIRKASIIVKRIDSNRVQNRWRTNNQKAKFDAYEIFQDKINESNESDENKTRKNSAFKYKNTPTLK